MKPKEERYFFGEEYRVCAGKLHVVCAFRAVLVADVVLLLGELLAVSLQICHLDAFFLVQLCVSIAVICCAAVEIARHGHYLIWTYIILKILGFLSNCFAVFAVTVLFVLGARGRTMLRRMIRWRYRDVEESNEGFYAAAVFALSVFQLLFCLVAIRCAHRCLRYNRKRAIAKYIAERSDALRVIYGNGHPGHGNEGDRRFSFLQLF